MHIPANLDSHSGGSWTLRPTTQRSLILLLRDHVSGDFYLDTHRKFDLTGGNIRNAILKATYLTDRGCGRLAQMYLERAAVTELLELGRLSPA